MLCTLPALIGPHLLKVFEYVRQRGSWVTAEEIAARTGMSGRTARGHARFLAEAGVFDRVEVFPAYRYHYAEDAETAGRELLDRLEQARAALPPCSVE